jgi:hypothetical protein
MGGSRFRGTSLPKLGGFVPKKTGGFEGSSRCTPELRGCLDIIDHGASYSRQREVMARGGRVVDVVEHLVDELRTDTPLRTSAPR